MGLQKDYLKDNQEMDQMLGDLDLLQVFKHLAPNSDNLCDLAGGLSLFNDVDVMNIGLCGDDVVSAASNSSAALPTHHHHHHQLMLSEPDTADIRCEIKKRHTQMMRKCDFLLRRLRKLQARSMGQHVNEEVNGLFDYAQRQLKRKERETKSISTMMPAAGCSSGGGIGSGGSAIDKQAAAAATTSMKAMLCRLTAVATEQQCSAGAAATKVGTESMASLNSSSSSAAPAAVAKKLTAATQASTTASSSSSSGWVPTFEMEVTTQLEDSAGLLQTEMKLVANAIDSDVTASSSGGESADEMVAYNNTAQQELSM